MESFGRDPSFVATTSIVGTPHAIKALPVVQRLGLPVVGLRSGAAELRDGLPGVFHLRASFNDEVNRIVTMLAGADMHRIAVVYSDDAFGRATMQQVRVAAAAKKIEVVTAIAAERNGSNVQQMVSAAVGQVSLGKQPLALLMLMIAEPMEKGVRHAREQLNYLYPIFAMSFCATKALAESQAPHLLGLGLMSAFPLPRSEVSPLSRDFMRLAKALKAGAEVSMTSFEAFFYASTLTEAIHQAKEPTRDGIRAALRAQLNVGGYRVAFDRVNVGYHYLTALRKSHDGVLRA
jgi:ABC-type branched-subunit amino acid transport system substrate-binding protein